MEKISRRRFIMCGAAAVLSQPVFLQVLNPFAFAFISGPADIKGEIFRNDAPKTLPKHFKEGCLYKRLDQKRVICGICPNQCILSPGDRGICRSRVNIDGTLYSLAYANPCSINVDPIEKKPLFHFLPKTTAFSVAIAGCNFRCLNCQNWEISQVRPEDVRTYELYPADCVNRAHKAGAVSIAYTYSEPTTFFEYMIETSGIAREKGIKNLWISNGYINREPLLELCRVLDAANVNLKAYSDRIYRKLNGGRLEPVLDTFKTLNDQGVHFEITNLVVPGYTDDEEMVKPMCSWILKNLGQDHPLHFLRFFPRYKLDRLSPTPVSTLARFREIAIKEGIRYVYLGNVPGHEGNNTYCHNCSKLLIERKGYFIPTYNLDGDKCRFCSAKIPGVWHGNDHDDRA